MKLREETEERQRKREEREQHNVRLSYNKQSHSFLGFPVACSQCCGTPYLSLTSVACTQVSGRGRGKCGQREQKEEKSRKEGRKREEGAARGKRKAKEERGRGKRNEETRRGEEEDRMITYHHNKIEQKEQVLEKHRSIRRSFAGGV